MANDYKDLIDTLIAEVGGEPRDSQVAAAYAIANRAAKSGKSVGDIVRAPKQFSGYAKPGPVAKKDQQDPKVRARLEAVWRDVENRNVPDPLNGGTMFHAKSMTPYWANEEDKYGTKTIGGHTYYLGGSPLPPSNISQVGSALDVIPRANPVMQSDDMRLMRNPNMSPSAQRSTTDSIVNNSFSPAPAALQDALNARVQRVAPEPASIDEMMLARTGVGGSRIAPMSTAGITASDRTRGNINLGVGLPQKMAGSTSVADLYSGIIPNPTAPIPASADERLMARMSPSTPQPRAIIPSSTIERGAPRISSMPLPSIGVSQIERNPVAPQTNYASGNPFVDAATAARQVAENRLAPSEALPPAIYGYSAQVPPSAPLPMPTVQRRMDTPSQAIASVAPIAPVPVTRAPMGGSVDQLIPQDVSLGSINNWIGQPNTVPNNINIAANAPTPLGRIQRQGSILPGIRLPGVLGMAQGLSQGINNASGTFGNNLDNFIQQNMRRGSNVGTPIATSAGYNYARTPQGGYVNVGAVNPSLTPEQRYNAASNYRTTNTAADRFKEQQDRSSSGASAYSISG